jgi:hypothetical protein
VVTPRRSRAAGLIAGLALLAAACAGAAPSEVAGPTSTASARRAAADATDAARSTDESATPSDHTSTGTSEPATAEATSAPPRVSCDPIERPPLQSGSHLLGDREPPVPYSSQPPTSGWHSSGHFDVEVRGRAHPLSEPEQVSVLEVGGVVVSYRGLAADDVARLRDRVRTRYAGRVAVTPYAGIPRGTVAFTSWGRLRRCDGVDLAALDRFVERFGPDGPVAPGH